MQDVIIIAALESEYFDFEGITQNTYYSGVGKVNAARLTTELIHQKNPGLILNIGTAGCLKREMLGEIFAVRSVVERDMRGEPLAPRGTVPFGNQDPILVSDFGDAKCATGDSFVMTRDDWLVNNNVDLVDMELFAIAKVCNHYSVKWRSIKFATDLADANAARDWHQSIDVAQKR
jgi:adenosylhomocysteine nucleosidase